MLMKDDRGDHTIVDREENEEGQVTPVPLIVMSRSGWARFFGLGLSSSGLG